MLYVLGFFGIISLWAFIYWLQIGRLPTLEQYITAHPESQKSSGGIGCHTCGLANHFIWWMLGTKAGLGPKKHVCRGCGASLYRTGNSISDDSNRLASLVIGTASSACLALLGTVVVPSFTNVYGSFDADLPSITRFISDYYYLLWLLPIIVVALWFSGHRRLSRNAGLVALFIGGPVTALFLYLPIFKLASGV